MMGSGSMSSDSMSSDRGTLVADIGGTNARFAIAHGNCRQGFVLEQVRRFENRHYADLREAAHAYLESCSSERPRRGCIAVAGPVASGVIELTNSSWSFERESLARDLRLEVLLAVNDFAAQARGAPLAPPEDSVTVRDVRPEPDAPCAVLGPGTGLGLGLLIPRGEDVIVVPTEGGHAGFAPRTEEEAAVGRIIASEFGFVSWERLLSGAGLVSIHRALSRLDGVPSANLGPEDITNEALIEPTSISRRGVDLFCAALGAFAGDVAVMSGARGGVYLGGGILPRIASLLEPSAFEMRFTQRGPMTRYAAAIPVWLTLSDLVPLLGAAALADRGGL